MFRILKTFEEIKNELPNKGNNLFIERHYQALCQGFVLILDFRDNDIFKITISKKENAKQTIFKRGYGVMLDNESLWKRVNLLNSSGSHNVLPDEEVILYDLKETLLKQQQESSNKLDLGLHDKYMNPACVNENNVIELEIINEMLYSFRENVFNKNQDHFMTRKHTNPRYNMLNLNNFRVII